METTTNTYSNKLILFDHDGTLCDTNQNAYDSMKYAIKMAAQRVGVQEVECKVDWNDFFSSTTGTTEKYGIEHICNILGLSLNNRELFSERYYQSRTNWYKNMKEFEEYVMDTYYPDAEKLLLDLANCGKEKYILGLATGNPKEVIKERMPEYIKQFFYDSKKELSGAFGDKTLSRKDLIVSAVDRAKRYGFSPSLDSLGFTTNVYYIADSKNDFYAALEAKIKTIWIPSRNLQIALSEKNKKDVRIIESLAPDTFIICNHLNTSAVYSFLGLDINLLTEDRRMWKDADIRTQQADQ